MSHSTKPGIKKQIIQDLLDEGEALYKAFPPRGSSLEDVYIQEAPSLRAWSASSINYLSSALSEENEYYRKFRGAVGTVHVNLADLLKANALLRSLIKDIDRGIFEQIVPAARDALASLSTLFDRFDQIAKQLRQRRNNRPTLDIKDEYDVQDLLYALLRIYFEDIVPEDYVQKVAGKDSRCDFALRDHDILVEAKMTRSNLKDKELGEELILDIAKYSAYPNVKYLVCFIYDPGSYIRNPKGLIKDIENLHSSVAVHVIIKPSH